MSGPLEANNPVVAWLAKRPEWLGLSLALCALLGVYAIFYLVEIRYGLSGVAKRASVRTGDWAFLPRARWAERDVWSGS